MFSVTVASESRTVHRLRSAISWARGNEGVEAEALKAPRLRGRRRRGGGAVLSKVYDCYGLESRSICQKFYFLESKSSFKIFHFLESRK